MIEKPNISVFFPVYNDEKTVRQVTEKSIKVLQERANQYEIIIIDDASPDDSGIIADQLAAEYDFVKVIHHENNKGYGAALASGFQNVQYEWICFTDGDDEYDIRDMDKFIKLVDFYDLIITFRYVRMYSTWRVFVSRIYNLLLRILFKTKFRDISTGLKMIRKNLLDDIEITSTSPFIGAEITIKSMLKGYRIGEVGIQTFPRQFGKSSSTSMTNIIKTIRDMRRIHREIFSKYYDLPKDRNRK